MKERMMDPSTLIGPVGYKVKVASELGIKPVPDMFIQPNVQEKFIPTLLPGTPLIHCLLAMAAKLLLKRWTSTDIEVLKLTYRLLDTFSELLGLQPTYVKEVFEDIMQDVRLNYYAACPELKLVLGVRAHSDPNVMTVVVEDDVGSHQVKKEKRCSNVKPIPDALVVNLADPMQAQLQDIRSDLLLNPKQLFGDICEIIT